LGGKKSTLERQRVVLQKKTLNIPSLRVQNIIERSLCTAYMAKNLYYMLVIFMPPGSTALKTDVFDPETSQSSLDQSSFKMD